MMYLKINLMKERKDLHDKNFKTTGKGFEEDTIRKDLPYSWIGRVNII